MDRAVGKRATVIEGFAGGQGRVRLGDTEWGAETVDGTNPAKGEFVVVDAPKGNGLLVRSGEQSPA